MSIISSQNSLFAITGNSQNKTAQTSSTDGALFQLISQVQEGASSNKDSGTTSGALGVSSSAFGALFGMGGDPLDALFGDSSSTGGVDGILSALGISDSSGLGGDDYDFLYGSGPLPAFLAEVKSHYGLSAEQSAALDGIALKYRNAEDTPATVDQIAAELAKAGIG